MITFVQIEPHLEAQLLHHGDEFSDPVGVALPNDGLLETNHHRPKQLSRCLLQWKENEEDIGSLGCMLPAAGFFTMQVIEITIVDGAPTGSIVVHDGEAFVAATVEARYVVELKKRRWGKYSLLQVKATSGLHTNLTIVSFICSPPRLSMYCLFKHLYYYYEVIDFPLFVCLLCLLVKFLTKTVFFPD